MIAAATICAGIVAAAAIQLTHPTVKPRAGPQYSVVNAWKEPDTGIIEDISPRHVTIRNATMPPII